MDLSLVDHLVSVCSCQDPYQLCESRRKARLHLVIRDIPSDRYTSEAWRTAILYIMGIYLGGSSDDMRRTLLLKLEEECRMAGPDAAAAT